LINLKYLENDITNIINTYIPTIALDWVKNIPGITTKIKKSLFLILFKSTNVMQNKKINNAILPNPDERGIFITGIKFDLLE